MTDVPRERSVPCLGRGCRMPAWQVDGYCSARCRDRTASRRLPVSAAEQVRAGLRVIVDREHEILVQLDENAQLLDQLVAVLDSITDLKAVE